jgi:uncharacterized NAD(P)/FAD-binding protein YdhS
MLVRHLAIVGGGFSGAMLAVQLLRRGARVTLIERERAPGRGLAYGAADPTHLLNVRAGNMSAYPDDPGHFVRWLAARGEENPAPIFARRRDFGDYVEQQLAAAIADAPGRFAHAAQAAVDAQTSPDGAAVMLSDGATVQADAAILALGNLPPPPPPGILAGALPHGLYWGDPWTPGATEGLADEDVVLVIGTGLTMVDIVLLLDARGFRGRIIALSRRGLVPLPHRDEPPATERRTQPPGALDSALVREVRRRGEAVGWRHAVDELRPFTQALWHDAGLAQRRRFIRHLRSWWDIHRHRIAPQVHERIRALIGAGRLSVGAGKLIDARAEDGQAEVRWRPRGKEAPERARVTRIINCTGPEGDLARSHEPLLRRLMERGSIRPGPIGIGVDADKDARVLGADGAANPRLYALGPLTRGLWWEIIAVPDIRGQVAQVAQTLTVRQEQS